MTVVRASGSEFSSGKIASDAQPGGVKSGSLLLRTLNDGRILAPRHGAGGGLITRAPTISRLTSLYRNKSG